MQSFAAFYKDAIGKNAGAGTSLRQWSPGGLWPICDLHIGK